MSVVARSAGLLAAFILAHAGASAADQKQIDAAIKKGADALKARRAAGGVKHGIGETALTGLALLEAGVPGTDPAVKAVTQAVRAAAPTQAQTYHVSLCLMYLDRYGDPADGPVVQALAVRLLAGQHAQGGWGYDCVPQVEEADAKMLQGLKPAAPGKLHPEVEKYAGTVRSAWAGNKDAPVDNSNTQFAVLAVWLSRKHGLPAEWVDRSLDRVEQWFLRSQNPKTGGWGYSPSSEGGSPSMHCAGLIGLATGVARRDEKRKGDGPKKDDPPAKGEPAEKAPDDPFFAPPAKGEGKPEAKKLPARPLDARDLAVQAGLRGLGVHLAESARLGRGPLFLDPKAGHGRHDLYFFWSVERVGVVYGVDKIGGVDWYEAGAHTLVHTQQPDGSWAGATLWGDEVSTAFAVLFLSKSNLARDLSGRVQKETTTEMRAGTPPGTPDPKTGGTTGGTKPDPNAPAPVVPGPAGSEAATLAFQLVRSTDKEWAAALGKLRDAKGAVHTQALVAAVARLDGDRRREARQALAERLARMTAGTLREMARSEDAELRRGAVLAMAMKDEKAHVPDLVAALGDDEDAVIRAARAGLKSLTGEDFGPPANATADQKALAANAWKQWAAKQKR